MKKIFLMLIILVFTGCVSFEKTSPDLVDKPMTFIYDFPISKDKIYSRSWEWLAVTYTSSKSVIELQDKSVGQIIGNGVGTVTPKGNPFPQSVSYSIKIDIKENKVRISFGNFAVAQGPMTGASFVQYKANYDAVKIYIDGLAEKYSSYVKSDNKDNF